MKALSIIVLIIIFPLFFLAIFGLSLKFTVQNKNFIKKELKSQEAYNKINRNLPEIVSLFPENKEGGGVAQVFTNVALGNILKEALTPQILEENTELLLDGKQASENQQKRFSDSIMKIVEAKYNTLPVCSPNQDTSEMTCRPAGVSFEQLQSQLPADSVLHITNADGEFKITQMTDKEASDASQDPQASQPQNNSSLSLLSMIGKLTYILPVILFFIILFLARGFAGNWRGMGKIFGIFLAVLSTLSLLVSLLLSLFNKNLASLIAGFANGLPKLKNDLILPMVQDIFSKISSMEMKISVALIVFGIIMIVGSWVLNKFVFKKRDVTKIETEK
ncbi:MAG: hypothetical protein Q7S53_01440 [bacterium]|nr:hypothetical protein [bacterium]